MEKLTFIKFGGSVITDKSGQEAADRSVIRQLAGELQVVRQQRPESRIILGHGSGSFGHYYAARYHVHQGLQPDEDWMGFALTAAAALRLNRLVLDTLIEAGVPALTVQPSAALFCSDGDIREWHVASILAALEQRLLPVIHGDVAFDDHRGCTIVSTETLLSYLALHTALRPTHMIMVGEDAVYTADPHVEPEAAVIPLITSANIEEVLGGQAGSSHTVDVTGGMQGKIQALWKLVQTIPGLEIQMIGSRPGLLQQVLLDQAVSIGTCIRLE